MAQVLSISTRVPAHCVTAADTARDLAAALPPHAAWRFNRMVQTSGNETRYSVVPPDRLRCLRTLEDRNRDYKQYALPLGEAVARDALAAASVDPGEIGAVIGVSSTGYLMPTLETHLADRLGLPATCRRLPLTQMGCAGGAAGLGLAAALTAAQPAAKVLVVSVELPSLSFPNAEPSPSDIVASTQFGDGAAAAVVSGDAAGGGAAVLATGSTLFPETIDRDGVQLTTAGLRLMRPRGLADLLQRQLGDTVDRFLAGHDLARRDIGFWAVHPRNPELLEAAAAGLGLPDSALAPSRAVWRTKGNVISSAVFHVLRELRDTMPPPIGTRGMIVAYGVGFSCEMVLLRAGGWLSGEGEERGTA
jgi:alkylresorcinol/alkylpyrone synthase